MRHGLAGSRNATRRRSHSGPSHSQSRGSGFWRGEEGSTTVLSALLIAAVVGLMMVAVAAGATLVAARKAAVAADLSAVAGAVAAQESDDACDASRRIAAENGARLLSCGRFGEDVQVEIERSGRRKAARAGPAADSVAGPPADTAVGPASEH
nr:Rv3654c family TadE-like protein [Corynebacterium lactis]